MSFVVNLLYDNVVAVLILVATGMFLRRYCRRRHLPPGPWPIPVIGNLQLLLAKDQREYFRKLRSRYGDLVSLSLGGRSILLVSGADMMREVLVTHSKDFNKRPPVFTVLKVGQGKAVVNSSGKTWKEHRTFMLEHMKVLGIGQSKFDSNIQGELQALLQILTNTDGKDFDPRYSLQTTISNIICSISFGKRFEHTDPDFIEILDMFEANMRFAGGTSYVNYFPFLEHLPGDPFKCSQCLKNLAKIQTKFSK